MLLALLFICFIFSLIFIFKSEDEQYGSKLSLLLFGFSMILSVLLLNESTDGAGFTFLFLFEISPASSKYEYVEILTGISIVSLLCYFGFKAYRK